MKLLAFLGMIEVIAFSKIAEVYLGQVSSLNMMQRSPCKLTIECTYNNYTFALKLSNQIKTRIRVNSLNFIEINYPFLGVVSAFPPLFEVNPLHRHTRMDAGTVMGACSSHWAYFDCHLDENHCLYEEIQPQIEWSWNSLTCTCHCIIG